MNNTDKDKAYRDLLLFLTHIKVITPSIASDLMFLSAFRKGSRTFQEIANLAGVLPDIDREEG